MLTAIRQLGRMPEELNLTAILAPNWGLDVPELVECFKQDQGKRVDPAKLSADYILMKLEGFCPLLWAAGLKK